MLRVHMLQPQFFSCDMPFYAKKVLLRGPDYLRNMLRKIQLVWIRALWSWTKWPQYSMHSSCKQSPPQIVMPHTASYAATCVLCLHTEGLVLASRARTMCASVCRPIFYQGKIKLTSEVTTNQSKTATTKFIFQNMEFVTALPVSRLPLA